MPNKKRGFFFYLKFMLIAAEAEEFTMLVEFPDGSVREVYFKTKLVEPRLKLVKSDSSSSSRLSHDDLRTRRKS